MNKAKRSQKINGSVHFCRGGGGRPQLPLSRGDRDGDVLGPRAQACPEVGRVGAFPQVAVLSAPSRPAPSVVGLREGFPVFWPSSPWAGE